MTLGMEGEGGGGKLRGAKANKMDRRRKRSNGVDKTRRTGWWKLSDGQDISVLNLCQRERVEGGQVAKRSSNI